MAINKRAPRSQKYQDIFLEIVFSNEMMSSFSNEESVYNRLNPFNYDEEVLELEDQLKVEFWRVVGSLLTKRQKQVIQLYVDGYTQMEIAKKLNVNQSSITKSLNGNVDYKNGRRVYGGAKKKMQKIIQNDERIKDLLRRINELRTEKW